MKFNFKIQSYQTDAVESTINIFKGQGHYEKVDYRRDLGKQKKDKEKFDFEEDKDVDQGFKNEPLELSDEQLLNNINTQQNLNNINLSPKLVNNLGRCSLDIEMETGTGKTYVYIKTMFEMNKHYGWSKFIVVVPSIAIREGVKKSFEMTQEHFMEQYNKKVRFFVYDRSNLNKLDEYSSNASLNVMIINTQAFASSLKEGGRNKYSRIIYSERDEFASRRPIDVIKANRPIIILDEPQKMGGKVTQEALKNFNPLFCLNYSATHTKHHNLVYVLDALDAYNKKLVKKIEVKGFEVKNFRGSNQYLYLDRILLSKKKPPRAKIELEIKYKNSINRENRILDVGDNLFEESKQMEQYKGYVISEIDPLSGKVSFLNGKNITKGEVIGDISEKDMRRIQIRETIASHLEKEEKLFNEGIKTLSLFFIDEVAKYRIYDDNGEEQLGEYGKMFEEEYNNLVSDYINLFNTPYSDYLKKFTVSEIHKGYFSIDKKGHAIDSKVKRSAEFSDDISAYELILKNKERLLDFEEPTRFIFSHSALREGWDNPNVFQICTLKHSDSRTTKRQEVGRGLRLCVDKTGNRMDLDSCGENIHKINKLTVIASESYKDFVGDLQKQIKTVLYDRPTKATITYFEGKTVPLYIKSTEDTETYIKTDEVVTINKKQAKKIYNYLIKNDYIDDDDQVTDFYRSDLTNDTLAAVPEELKPISSGVHRLVQAIFDESILEDMVDDGNKTKIPENKLNENFYKKEFQTLWKNINHKYAYTVDFDSHELIEKAVKEINKNLYVTQLQYTASTGQQTEEMNEHELERGESFTTAKTSTKTLYHAEKSRIKYDLIGKVAQGTTLTRKTTATILKSLDTNRLYLFRYNPEEFISKVIKLINEQKATMIVEHIAYNTLEETYDSGIFTKENYAQGYEKAYKAEHHIQDYVFTDGSAKKSVEHRFAEELDHAKEVCVYAKLPRTFHIPTPLGNYAPDWAIAFKEGTVKHIYFIAETKGTMNTLELRPIEQAKISCAKKLFNKASTSKVRYHEVSSYQQLLDVMNKIE